MPIYLEAKPVVVAGVTTSYYHLYLVDRASPQSPDDLNSLAWRNSGSVLRGGMLGTGTGTLKVESGDLSASDDKYNSQADISSRLIWDITDAVGGESGWGTMSSALAGIAAAGYTYEVPLAASSNAIMHVANSNATILTLLNAVNVDVRTIIGSIASETPGAGIDPTLLGQGTTPTIEAASNLHSGVAFLGRNNVNDIFKGTGYGDTYYGEQSGPDLSSNDTVSYANSSTAVTMTIDAIAQTQITVNVAHGTDQLFGIEKVVLSPYNDTVIVDTLPPKGLAEVDGGGTQGGGSDTLNLQPLGPSITFNDNKIQHSNTIFEGFTVLKIDPGNDLVVLDGPDDASFKEVDFGNGNDAIKSNVVNLTINLGSGDDTVGHVGQGTVVNAGGGLDSFVVSNDELIVGSTPTDRIYSPGGILLKGAVGQVGSSDPWIVGPDGTKYGFNQQGDLVIQDLLGDDTYVSGYQGGPGVSFPDQTDGIFVGLSKGSAEKLLDLARPFITYISDIFKVGQDILYTKSGLKFFNVDPLVFDLTGQGINLTAMSPVSPMLDMLGTGFAVNTGWVEPNDGVLVLQQPGQNGTPNVTEMFGGPGAQGFAALAQYDANSDGVIDANDAIYSQLRIWVDSNGNGAVDAGELETLQQAGIASINLTAAAQTNDTDAGNTIVSTGTFTFTDGTTGNVDQVNFNVDSYHTQYLGDTTVSTAAAAMPNRRELLHRSRELANPRAICRKVLSRTRAAQQRDAIVTDRKEQGARMIGLTIGESDAAFLDGARRSVQTVQLDSAI